jgi:hypothetical protein
MTRHPLPLFTYLDGGRAAGTPRLVFTNLYLAHTSVHETCKKRVRMLPLDRLPWGLVERRRALDLAGRSRDKLLAH